MSENAKVIEGAYAAFGRGDIAAVLDILADDVDWSSPETLPQGGQYHGKDGVGKFFTTLGGAWKDLALDIESVSEAGGDAVVGVVHATGTLSNGQASSYSAAHVFTIRAGKVVRFREFTDVDAPLT
jgi:ketosteroid isomerase-like protein